MQRKFDLSTIQLKSPTKTPVKVKRSKQLLSMRRLNLKKPPALKRAIDDLMAQGSEHQDNIETVSRRGSRSKRSASSTEDTFLFIPDSAVGPIVEETTAGDRMHNDDSSNH